MKKPEEEVGARASGRREPWVGVWTYALAGRGLEVGHERALISVECVDTCPVDLTEETFAVLTVHLMEAIKHDSVPPLGVFLVPNAPRRVVGVWVLHHTLRGNELLLLAMPSRSKAEASEDEGKNQRR